VDSLTGPLSPVVYDSVGKDTFMKSLDCLKPKGMMVSFGQCPRVGIAGDVAKREMLRY
jgi:NADPH:quinone reductase-like Zn-dependent oxidoreductase